jgi:hypothetical protein
MNSRGIRTVTKITRQIGKEAARQLRGFPNSSSTNSAVSAGRRRISSAVAGATNSPARSSVPRGTGAASSGFCGVSLFLPSRRR